MMMIIIETTPLPLCVKGLKQQLSKACGTVFWLFCYVLFLYVLTGICVTLSGFCFRSISVYKG